MKQPFGESNQFGRLPESKPVEKYEIPFIWGSLHVSEQADKSYGLVPLTTSTLESDANSQFGDIEDADLQTDVWLVGPSEMPPLPIAVVGDDTYYGYGVSNLTKNGIELWCAYGGTGDDIAQAVKDHMVAEGFEIPEDAPPDYIDQEVHHAISHRLADGVVQNLQSPVRDFLKNSANKRALREVRKNLMLGFGGTAWVDGTELLSKGHLDTLGEVSGTGIAALGTIAAYLGLKKYLSIQRAINGQIDFLADRYAQAIGDDIHRTYCRHHFDLQTEETLGFPPEN